MAEARVPSVVSLEPARLVEEPENSLWLQMLVGARDHGPELSVTWVQIAGRHRRVRTRRSVRVYVLLSGVLTIQIDDRPPAAITPGGAAVVPRNTAYELEGTATYLVINAPAFVEDDDEYLPAGG